MPKVQRVDNHDQILNIPWRNWESNREYKNTKHLYNIIDPGDPVIVYKVDKNTGESKRVGTFGRSEAEVMVKGGRNKTYEIKELSSKDRKDLRLDVFSFTPSRSKRGLIMAQKIKLPKTLKEIAIWILTVIIGPVIVYFIIKMWFE